MKSLYTEKTVLGTLLELEKLIPYYTGYALEGISLKSKGNGWLLVITVSGENGRFLVAFIKANSIYHCLDILTTALHSKTITLKWHIDKFKN